MSCDDKELLKGHITLGRVTEIVAQTGYITDMYKSGIYVDDVYTRDVTEGLMNRVLNRLFDEDDMRPICIVCVNLIRDRVRAIYCYERSEPLGSTLHAFFEKQINDIVSAMGYRFDAIGSDHDYSLWTDAELLMAMTLSSRLPWWNNPNKLVVMARDRMTEILKKQTVRPRRIVKKYAIDYLFSKSTTTHDFGELYGNVFVDDEGKYLLKMKNWDNMSLFIALVTLGAEIDTPENLRKYKCFENESLKILTDAKNPFLTNSNSTINDLSYAGYRLFIDHMST